METDQFVEIGKLHKPHGIKGEIKVTIDEIYEHLVAELGYIHLEMGGHMIPFFVENIRSNFTLVKLEDINSPEDALTVAHKTVFLMRKDVPEEYIQMSEEEDEYPNPYSYLNGYFIHDIKKGEVGRIEEVLELPMQFVALVPKGEGEILIPLNDEFISDIDEEAQIIYMTLPDGLLDL